jgi:hypothetical protein
MKKILLLIIVTLTLFISGCTAQDYIDNREAFKADCLTTEGCMEYMIEDANALIKKTQAYKDLESDLLLSQTDIVNLQIELDLEKQKVIDLQLQVNTNTDNIEELFTRVEKLEQLLTTDSDTGNYINSLGLYGVIQVIKLDDDVYEVQINMQSIIDYGFNESVIKPAIKNFIKTDLLSITSPENITILFFKDGNVNDYYYLSDLLS